MGLRKTLGRTVRRIRGKTIRRPERPTGPAEISPPTTAPRIQPVGPGKWLPSDPFVPHPQPRLTRHELLAELHERLRPRTYLEIGIRDGASLVLSRARSIGVDPAFKIGKPIQCDVQLVKATSDDFFAGHDPMAHFAGVPVDLAFIDGMHLSEFALRDFINTEPYMARTGVVVLDDTLPRNGLEAARDRQTSLWTGDVYKAVEILRRRRPDLVVLLVNTAPTGTAVIVGLDPDSSVLNDSYGAEENYLLRPDPQTPPQEYMDRSIAIEPEALLASPVWRELVLARESRASFHLDALWSELRGLQRQDNDQEQLTEFSPVAVLQAHGAAHR